MSERFIVVTGVGSGGTSCVSGMLHHLGVDMGRLSFETRPDRPYPVYEDLDAPQFRRYHDGAIAHGFSFDWKGYQAYRAANAKPGQRYGIKCGGGLLLEVRDDPEVAASIDLIRVTRPFRDTIRGEAKRFAAAHPGWSQEQIDRQMAMKAGQAGTGWWATDVVCQAIKPLLEIEYPFILAEPWMAVGTLVRRLGLQTNEEQRLAAARFVKVPQPAAVEAAPV